ncbi:hypothetical protein F2P56_007820 [Juglans regia]|uniref:Uncharacterized protein n=1 Tax=Juglans regia TaxID=51240 RepID=A0A833Y2Z8_JUGRE|nr:hypothetical protein F2P56_007820 [Juglans regia]
MVGQHVWAKLYDRWGSEAFKKMSKQNKENRNKLKINHTARRKSFVRILEENRSTTPNLVQFYKEVRWSKKNDAFVTEMTGELYNQMVGKMLDLEPRQRSEEAAASVFRDVLGYRPGYAKGLGEMIILDFTKKKDCECQKYHAEEVERHKKEAEYYKSEFEELRASVRVLLERQTEYDKTLDSLVNTIQSQGESHKETYGD